MKDYRRQLMNDLSDGIYEWAIPKDFDEGFNEVLSNLQKSNPYNQKLAEVLDCFYRRGMNQRRTSDACQVGARAGSAAGGNCRAERKKSQLNGWGFPTGREIFC